MSKMYLRGEQIMSDALHIAEAARWADWLTRRESRGPRDDENAWGRLETRYGVPFQTFWSLRYRKPKDMWTSIFLRLAAAYNAEKERQQRLLAAEESIAEQLSTALEAVAAETSPLVANKRTAKKL